MGHGVYENYGCRGVTKDQPFTPTEHQILARDAFLNSNQKGMLFFHKLGSGKTCTTYLIADAMLRQKKVKKVFIITPGSLRAGWVSEYCKVCGYKEKYLIRDYIFVTYNYAVRHRLPDLNDSLVVIDEVHNLINGVKNRSQNAVTIYDAIMNADCRVIALTGTVIFNYIWEFPILGRLLKPGDDFPDIMKGDDDDDYEISRPNQQAFESLFNKDELGKVTPKNPITMNDRMSGIISYYPGAGSEFMPEVIHHPPFKVLMSFEQEKHYWARKFQEEAMDFPPDKSLMKTDPVRYEFLKSLYILARKHILIRQASNFYYPPEYEESKDLLAKDGGWIEHENFNKGQLLEYSKKFAAFLTNVVLHPNHKQVAYIFFKNKSGALILRNLLRMCGISAGVFSGDQSDYERTAILKKFNSPENRYGERMQILFITEAGGEGISLKEVRDMHILESSPRVNKTLQAIGRIARYKSHVELPPEERKVDVWYYWSVCSPEPFKVTTQIYLPNGKLEEKSRVYSDKTGVDEELYNSGQKTRVEIDSFLNVLKRASVTPAGDIPMDELEDAQGIEVVE